MGMYYHSSVISDDLVRTPGDDELASAVVSLSFDTGNHSCMQSRRKSDGVSCMPDFTMGVNGRRPQWSMHGGVVLCSSQFARASCHA